MREVPPDLAAKLVASAPHLTGGDEVRMDDIARASGIPRATLYYYFAGKDDILAFLLDAHLADLAARIAHAVAATDDARSRLAEVLGIILELPVITPEASQLLLLNLSRIAKLPDIAAAFDQACIAPIRQVLEDAIRRKEIASVDVATSATAIFGAATIAGLGSALLHQPDHKSSLIDDVVTLVWDGIAPR